MKRQSLYEDLLHDQRMIDCNKVYVGSADYAYTFFIDEDDVISYKDVDNQTETPFLYRRYKDLSFTPLRIFNALGAGIYVLANDGHLYWTSGGGRTPRANQFHLDADLILTETRWLDASGGATSDTLYTVGENGVVYQHSKNNYADVKLEQSDFKNEKGFFKFQEGLNIKVGINSDGQVYVWDYERSTVAPWKIPVEGVKDFTLGRKYAFDHHLKSLEKPLNSWSLQCGVKYLFRDPWLNQEMGFTEDGIFILKGQQMPCLSQRDYYRKISPYLRISGNSLQKSNNFFSQTYLELKKKHGEIIKVHPYHLPKEH